MRNSPTLAKRHPHSFCPASTRAHADSSPIASTACKLGAAASCAQLWTAGLCAITMGLALLAGCGGNNDPVQPSQQKLDQSIAKLRAAIETTIKRTVPSLSVLIQTPGGTYFSSSTAAGVPPVTPTTYFRFASITKPFTATAIMKMHQDGWLDYRDHIVESIPGSALPYVPESPSWNIPYKEKITIRQLLQHNAGVYNVDAGPVPGCGDMGYTECMLKKDPNHQFTATEIVEQAAINQLSHFPPGTDNYQYSNTGYTILGEIISRVYTQRSGQTKTYSDYLYDHVFGPSTIFPLDLHFPYLSGNQRLPIPYVCGRIYLPGGSVEEHCADNLSAQVAEGNGIGTLQALNRYVRTLYQGQNVLEQKYADLMKTDTTAFNPYYGLGTTHIPNLGYGHNGYRIGYFSQATYDPDLDVSVVVMLPMSDISSEIGFRTSFNALNCAGWKARAALGYSGKPDGQTCPGD